MAEGGVEMVVVVGECIGEIVFEGVDCRPTQREKQTCKQTVAIGTNTSESETEGTGRGRWRPSGRKKTSLTMCLSQQRQEKPQQRERGVGGKRSTERGHDCRGERAGEEEPFIVTFHYGMFTSFLHPLYPTKRGSNRALPTATLTELQTIHVHKETKS